MQFQLFEFPTLRLHRTHSQPLSSSVELSSAHVTQLFSLHILVSCIFSVALKHAFDNYFARILISLTNQSSHIFYNVV